MITTDNLTFALDGLTQDEVKLAQTLDRFKLEVLSSNSGSISRLSELDEDETEEDITDNGNIVCDLDDLMILFEESGSLNPWLIELM
tara:strand:+ start:368 stop:628 length:261 start_codon:yes stop_codon:yes gene_type:complete